MATIGTLPPAGAIDPVNDLFAVWQGNTTKAATAQQVLTAILSQIPIIIPFSYVFGIIPAGNALFWFDMPTTDIFGLPFRIVLPVGLTGSVAKCGTAPTNAISLPIIEGGTMNSFNQIIGGTQTGSVNYAAGSTTGTFTFLAAQTLTANMTLGIGMDPNGDATFANPSITMIGGR